MSGAGTGKGLLARCICIIAFGRQPSAVTSGANAEELEKRIAAELIGGSPALFLDNQNGRSFKSDLLASAVTERPASVRILGKSQMVPLNASSFVVLTGNALTVSEDLARRFIEVGFDAGTEDPEEREFTIDIRAELDERRPELPGAVLTIWRWGRLSSDIKRGRALGSFPTWCEWVRDPLLALGCQDPVERIGDAKKRDSRRQVIAELFAKQRDENHPGGAPASKARPGMILPRLLLYVRGKLIFWTVDPVRKRQSNAVPSCHRSCCPEDDRLSLHFPLFALSLASVIGLRWRTTGTEAGALEFIGFLDLFSRNYIPHSRTDCRTSGPARDALMSLVLLCRSITAAQQSQPK